MKRFGTILFLILTVCICNSHSQTADFEVQHYEENKELVFRLLVSCPSWSQVDINNKAECAQIMDTMERISRFNEASIKSGMEIYIKRVLAGKITNGTTDLENLRILNRILFCVPDKVSKMDYSKWVFETIPPGYPTKNGYVLLLWPLEMRADHKLEIVGRFSAAISGNFHNPLDEFDDFKVRFGNRNTSKCSDR
jgi:hypothetical protein